MLEANDDNMLSKRGRQRYLHGEKRIRKKLLTNCKAVLMQLKRDGDIKIGRELKDSERKLTHHKLLTEFSLFLT